MTARSQHFLYYFLSVLGAILIFILHVYGHYPLLVENFYSRKIYFSISQTLRSCFGKTTICIGDLLAICFLCVMVVFAVRATKLIWQRKYACVFNIRTGLIVFIILAYNHLMFNVVWGLNYNRISLSEQLQLPSESITRADVIDFLNFLTDKVNEQYKNVRKYHERSMNFARAKQLVVDQLTLLDNKIHQTGFIDSVLLSYYVIPSIKRSLVGFLFTKLGVAGYHHPFTGEAVINAQVPPTLLPAVVVHEVFHQLGYPREAEARLASYISASYMSDPVVSYSVYLDTYLSCIRQLAKTDEALANRINARLRVGVLADIQNIQRHFHDNEWSSWMIIEARKRRNTIFFSVNTNFHGKQTHDQYFDLLLLYEKMKVQTQQKAANKHSKKLPKKETKKTRIAT